jgi:hypothetical protein
MRYGRHVYKACYSVYRKQVYVRTQRRDVVEINRFIWKYRGVKFAWQACVLSFNFISNIPCCGRNTKLPSVFSCSRRVSFWVSSLLLLILFLFQFCSHQQRDTDISCFLNVSAPCRVSAPCMVLAAGATWCRWTAAESSLTKWKFKWHGTETETPQASVEHRSQLL